MTCVGCGRQVLSLAWLAVMAAPEAIHLNGPYCPGCAAVMDEIDADSNADYEWSYDDGFLSALTP